MGRTPTHVTELRNDKHIFDITFLAEQNVKECAPHLDFKPSAIIRSCEQIFKDVERAYINAWIVYEGDKPIGYAVAYCSPFLFNDDNCAKLEIWYVLPEHRKSWAAIKLIRAYEEWARLNGAIQMYTGVARLDTDEAKHIRKLFPKLGYNWCGSYYIKETV